MSRRPDHQQAGRPRPFSACCRVTKPQPSEISDSLTAYRSPRAFAVVDRTGWSPAERRREVGLWRLEIAAGTAMGALLTLAIGVHVGRGIAFLVSGAGWAFPDLAELFTSLPGLLSGDSVDGLDHPPQPAPPAWVLVVSIASVQLAMICAATAVARLAWVRWGPGGLPGTARRGEMARLLGVRRLRRAAAIIRPDLYGRNGR